MNISYSAPAKIILSGEHSVVYTKPAFVTAVDYSLTATITQGTMPLHDDIKESVSYIDSIVRHYIQKEGMNADIQPFVITYTSTIPSGRGMGSSAAFCVATTAALLHFYTGKEADKQVISSLAYQCEKHFHGIPSGVDVSASTYGGLIFYRKEFEFLKTVSALNFKIPKQFEEKLILIDTGRPTESTKEMVALVGKKYNENPRRMDQTFAAIERVTKRMVVSIVKEDINMFTESIRDNQSLLEDLSIVSPSTKELLQELSAYGTGKVTGAGGCKSSSGLVLYIVEDTSIFAVLKKRNINWLPFRQDTRGIEQVLS